MPNIEGRVILRAWRQRGEPTRIHYIAAAADGVERRLYVDESNPLYAVVDSYLVAGGYDGPKDDQ